MLLLAVLYSTYGDTPPSFNLSSYHFLFPVLDPIHCFPFLLVPFQKNVSSSFFTLMPLRLNITCIFFTRSSFFHLTDQHKRSKSCLSLRGRAFRLRVLFIYYFCALWLLYCTIMYVSWCVVSVCFTASVCTYVCSYVCSGLLQRPISTLLPIIPIVPFPLFPFLPCFRPSPKPTS